MRTRKQYRTLLKRTHGYKSTLSRTPTVRCTPVNAQRSWNLAQAIAKRYAAIEHRWPLMAFLFKQSDQGAAVSSNTYHISNPSVFINPRMLLRTLVSHKEEIQRVLVNRPPLQPSRYEVVPTVVVTGSRQRVVQPPEEVMARIIRRTVREDAPVCEAPRGLSRVVMRGAQQDAPIEDDTNWSRPTLARVWRSPAKATDEASVAERITGHDKEKPHAGVVREKSLIAVIPPQLDITRITDQVMQVLDKRIVAQRERMGRI